MIYQGKALSASFLEDGIAELCFDLQGDSVNKFNRLTLEELGEATQALASESGLKGVVVTSGKPVFIVGADITEFTELFTLPDAELRLYELIWRRAVGSQMAKALHEQLAITMHPADGAVAGEAPLASPSI